ncbi:MAG: hypothetical protein HQ541_04010, partial [Mariniphaga sp.]|nr:hypothetical protein [Mariniphaga sp.]
MKTKVINGIFKVIVLVLVVLGLSTCNTSQKASTTSNMFKIPKKIINAEDLPSDLQANEQNPVHYVQLYPDEKPQSNFTIAENIFPDEEIENEITELSDIEAYVEEAIDDLIHSRAEPIFYHI